MTLYADLPSALARAKERSRANTADEPYLTELLQMSAGQHKTTGETVYRPFYVAAKYLQQARRDQTLKKADGAEFTGQVIPIASLLDLQASLDDELTIPEKWRLDSEIPSAAQLKTAYETALLSLRQFQPRGFQL